jgi:mono/diheme cytochrome c family protein
MASHLFPPSLAWLSLLATAAFLSVAPGSAAERLAPVPASPEFVAQGLNPFLKKHCAECHRGADPEGGVRLEGVSGAAAVAKDRAVWERVVRMVRSRQMPPEEKPRPPQSDADAVTAWLDATLRAVDCSGPPDPGRVTLRRLNRTEYANTIRDLLGVSFAATEELPVDDTGYGFDNIGDVLSMPPVLMEKYLAAAERIAEQALAADRPHGRILVAKPGGGLSADAATRQVVRRLASRAFRRPVRPEELDRLAALAESARKGGDSFERSVQLTVEAMLVSPWFLFRVELDPPAAGSGGVRLLDEHELASRMSYFLWSSMPDGELFDLAAKGLLRKHLDGQVRRMLKDPKSRALVENFAGQWLQLRNLDTAAPDRRQFPAFNEELRRAMRIETEMLFAAVLGEDRSVLDLLDADYTFVNEPLARLYGLPNVAGSEFRRVSLALTPRGGVLTHASVLTVTSNPTRTSPVKRGKWILETILGEPPPDPPPNVPQLKEDRKAAASASLRERLEQHRKDPGCAACHRVMDALGFGMENFDPVGAWRTSDGQFPIDASGTLPDGASFNGPEQLRAVLRGQGKEKFARCLTEKLLTYALGRGLEPPDGCTVDRIVKKLPEDQHRFSSLVVEIIRSDPFQKRRVQERKP